MVEVEVSYRDMDSLGRVVLPAKWRKYLPQSLALYRIENEIIIKSRETGSFKKIRGSIPARGNKSIDELKEEGARDWQRE